MPAARDCQNFYSPLSQNMTTDDDGDQSSEEELMMHPANAIRRTIARRTQNQNNKTANVGNNINNNRTSSAAAGIPNNTQSPPPPQSAAAAKHQQMLASLHSSNGGDSAAAAFASSSLSSLNNGDQVAILGASRRSSLRHPKPNDPFFNGSCTPPMSPRRRCAFIASLALCVLTVVVFVWLIPCPGDSDQCTAGRRGSMPRTQNWLRHYEGLELKGGINVVRGAAGGGRSPQLVLMYRGERLMGGSAAGGGGAAATALSSPKQKRSNGIIALVGASGAVSWFVELAAEPQVIDCTLLDADGDGTLDCLVLDEHGVLRCMDAVAGTLHYFVTGGGGSLVPPPPVLSFPLVLPDISGDGVNDLLWVTKLPTSANVSTSNASTPAATMWISSGATGQGLGRRDIVAAGCVHVHKMRMVAPAQRVTFNCVRPNGTELLVAHGLDELLEEFAWLRQPPEVEVKAKALAAGPPRQHKFFGQRKETLVQRNIYSVAGRELVVENSGRCPDACNVSVQLVEQGGKVVRSFSGARMYGMVPAVLSFNASGGGGAEQKKPAIHGFVIKLWQWAENETDVQMQFGGRRRRMRRDAKDAKEEFDLFEEVMPKERPLWRYPPRQRRSTQTSVNDSTTEQPPTSAPTPTTPFPSHEDGVVRSKMRLIRERVVLIVFNSTDTRIENTSQSNIVQFCRQEADIGGEDHPNADATKSGASAASSPAMCQPDLNYQENSVLIADLDADGSQELVTYYTTYVNGAGGDGADGRMEWKLMNYVQLLRLEQELPKLYVVAAAAADGAGGVGGGGNTTPVETI